MMNIKFFKSFVFTLDPEATLPSLPYGLLMIETSSSATISPRQACAVESGARQGGLEVNMVMTSPFLDLSDNTTCYIYASNLNINFFYFNTSTLLGKFIQPCNGTLNTSLLYTD